MEEFTQYIWLVPVGLLLGLFGTLVGAGGGFLLVPLLLLVYPQDAPEIITSISLAVVGINATAGSISYARMRRIDYRAGVLFAVAAIPGAVLGAITTSVVPHQLFHLVLGLVIVLVGLNLVYRPGAPRGQAIANHCPPHPDTNRAPCRRNEFNRSLGFWLSAGVGYLSSLLGIGGGIIHVPALVRFLHFPVHTATATSHFVLAIMASSATVTHIVSGAFHHGSRRAIMLGLGAIVGAPMGAGLSRRLHGTWIIRALGGALLLAGSRLLIWP
ncbi:MAG: sulfite exporter TauE/SafE family protein [Phycisphaerae bacterium]|nr:sulfite exporter TauE/SafE family protein [Phycisphaerae bacterium]